MVHNRRPAACGCHRPSPGREPQEPLYLTVPVPARLGRLFFQILGSIAEFEHSLMSERTRDGLAAAPARPHRGTETKTRAPSGQTRPGNV
ncbi:recombinase family protein [Arthrobacter sp.]|uniref:recombinase family protein n=1 Tax=Arthrobacter sp. TaxID=1667 RepID=UPI0035C6F12F